MAFPPFLVYDLEITPSQVNYGLQLLVSVKRFYKNRYAGKFSAYLNYRNKLCVSLILVLQVWFMLFEHEQRIGKDRRRTVIYLEKIFLTCS